MSAWLPPFLLSFCSLRFVSLTRSLAVSPLPLSLPFRGAHPPHSRQPLPPCGWALVVEQRGAQLGCWGAGIRLRLPRGELLPSLPGRALWTDRGPAFRASETTQIRGHPWGWVGGERERKWVSAGGQCGSVVLVGFVGVCLGLPLLKGICQLTPALVLVFLQRLTVSGQ